MTRTIQYRRTDKRDMHAQITMVRGAVETEVDPEGYRCPRWIFAAAVKADLGFIGGG